MILKLFLDEDVWAGLADALRSVGYDVVSTNELGRKGASDEEQLLFAASQGRAILTHNIRDFVPLAQQFAVQKQSHAGIIVASQFQKGLLLQKTMKLLQELSAEQLANTLRFI